MINGKKVVWVVALLGLTSCGDTAQGDPFAAPGTPIPITVEQLAKAYDDNEAAAQVRFGHKRLAVAATVKQVNLGADDKPFVNLAGGDLLPAQLHFAEGYEQEAATLVREQGYVFECLEVSEMLGTPMLSNCRIGAAP